MGNYSIWVAEFASIPQFPDALMLAGTVGMAMRRLPYTYTVIQGQGRTILVDAGFQYGDHMGGLDYFPNATFHIQKRELAEWSWALSVDEKLSKLHFCVNPADILRAVQIGIEGRLNCIDGDMDDLFFGIDVRLARDTHTWGSQYIRVRNSGGTDSDDVYILAGDLVYTYDNLGLSGNNIGQYTQVAQAVGGQYNLLRSMEALVAAAADDPYRIIPAHEDRLGEHFPSRTSDHQLRVTEIALADGVASKIC
jgi:glyoxylase-like metal-dependent hydrolase (beta-lactamase superfamily II)